MHEDMAHALETEREMGREMVRGVDIVFQRGERMYVINLSLLIPSDTFGDSR